MNLDEKNKRYILDSYALIAYFEKETGAETVKNLLHQALTKNVELSLCAI